MLRQSRCAGAWTATPTATATFWTAAAASALALLAGCGTSDDGGSRLAQALSSTTSLAPSADAYVRGGTYDTTNYGTSTDLIVKASSANYARNSYLTFKVASPSVASAVLRLYVDSVGTENTNTIPVELFTSASDSWGETTITWNNAPAAGAKIGSVNVDTASAGTWVQYDVTSQVNAETDGKVSFELTASAGSGRGITFASREDATHAPTLQVTTAAADAGASEAGVKEAGTGGDAGAGSEGGAGVDASLPGWTLVWSDEFNGANGSDVDPTKWVHDVGDGSNVSSGVWQPGSGWGNDELEYYTAGNANTKQEDGNLVISAQTAGASAYKCWYGTCQWTSGRIKTYVGPPTVKNLFAQTYGRFEMRAQIPAGQGLWPAFWMMGINLFTSDWPACGELDIMEEVGDTPGTVYGTSHSTKSGDDGVPHSYTLPNKADLSAAFHVYAMEWSATKITWYLDDIAYGTEAAPSPATTANWPFADPKNPFFIILNLALSNGDDNSWGAAPNAQTSNPAQMKVDYVRVYQAQ